MMRAGNPIPDDCRERIVAAARTANSIREVAALCDVAPGTVRKYLDPADLDALRARGTARGHRRRFDGAQVLDLLRAGRTVSATARQAGCNYKTVVRIREEAGALANVLKRLSAAELADYQVLMYAGYRRVEALRAIKREDLIATF